MTTNLPAGLVRRPCIAAVAVALLGAGAAGGCGSSDTPTTASTGSSNGAPANATAAPPKTTRPAAASYDPKIVPADFSTRIDNPYLTLTPGTVRVSRGVKDGVPEKHTTTVSHETKMIDGVEAIVVQDVVTSTGGVLVEKASDWFAQDQAGNVWYFGEATADYEKGVVVSTDGSWEAGVDGAKPGIVMPAHPKPGPEFYSEFRPGVAEDKAQVLRIGAHLTTGFGSYEDVVVIRDSNPLDPGLVSHKWYGRGVGLLRSKRVGSDHQELSDLVSIQR
jgi:hypothetical protein